MALYTDTKLKLDDSHYSNYMSSVVLDQIPRYSPSVWGVSLYQRGSQTRKWFHFEIFL